MSEELNNQNNVEPQVETPTNAPAMESAPQDETQPTAPVEQTSTEPAPEPIPAAEPAPQPQVIVQQERGFAHYVGFALLCVLCIAFYFMPGIAITFAISLIPGISLGAIAAWTFSAIFSIIA